MKKHHVVFLIFVLCLSVFSFAACDKETLTAPPSVDTSESDANHLFFNFSSVSFNTSYASEGVGDGFLVGDEFDFNELKPTSKVDTGVRGVMPRFTIERDGVRSSVFRINQHGLYPNTYTFTEAGSYTLVAEAQSEGVAITKKYALNVARGDLPTEITYSYKVGEAASSDVHAGEETTFVATVKKADGEVDDDFYRNRCYWQDGTETLEGRYFFKEYPKTVRPSSDTLYFCYTVINNLEKIYTVRDAFDFEVKSSIAKIYVDFDEAAYGQGYTEFDVSSAENVFLDTAKPYIEYRDGTTSLLSVATAPRINATLVYIRYDGEEDFSIYDPSEYNTPSGLLSDGTGYRVSNGRYIFNPLKAGAATIRFAYCRATYDGFAEEIIEGSERQITILGELPTRAGFLSISYTGADGIVRSAEIKNGEVSLPKCSFTIQGVLINGDGETSPIDDYTVRAVTESGVQPGEVRPDGNGGFTVDSVPQCGYCIIEIASVYAPSVRATVRINIVEI